MLVGQDCAMAYIVVFHSVFGLRAVETGAAELFRAAGHEVLTPDLYAGQVATSLDEGFALMDRIGWSTIERRAHDAVRRVPGDAVLTGFSMGAGVVHALLPHRTETAGVLLLHGLAEIPGTARTGLPVQVHVADPDPLVRPAEVTAWRADVAGSGAAAQVFTYPGAGHFYTDADLPDYDERAATLTWQRALAFLGTLGR
jgi:dienelactone hydrolase